MHSINITQGDQNSPAFLKISPNNKIPAIIDRDNGISLMESGAILLYLAKKYGKFLPKDNIARAKVNEWLMWQMSSLGPICGQAHHFLYYNPGKSEYSENRFKKVTQKLYQTLNKRLEKFQYVSGANNGEYTIADIAIWPWIARHRRHQVSLKDYPGVLRWYKEIYDRPAVQKGYHIPHFEEEIPL